jgi:hypothetical protein
MIRPGETRMKIMRALAVAAVILTGCAALPPPQGHTFSGTVRDWDTGAGTVTLVQDDGRLQTVRISPDQFTTLRQQQYATVRGELVAGPVEPPPPRQPMTARPKGVPDELEIPGTVAAVDPSGRIGVTSDRGPMELWVPAGADQRFQRGAPVRVRMTVQPLEMVPAASAPPPPPAAPVAREEPGDYAMVIGRVLEVEPTGGLRVDAPNGPIVVMVPEAKRYRVGDDVEVRSSVHPSQ